MIGGSYYSLNLRIVGESKSFDNPGFLYRLAGDRTNIRKRAKPPSLMDYVYYWWKEKKLIPRANSIINHRIIQTESLIYVFD